MRLVAGWGTVAERLQRGGAVAELLAGALRQSCWPGLCGERLRCGRDADAREIHREEGKKACEKEKQHLRRTCTYPSR